MPQEILKSMFMHHFLQYSFSSLGNIHIHIQGMLENGGNFENDIPIPDYRIHLVLDRISYDLNDKSNIQE